MNVNVEHLEHSTVRLTIEVEAERFIQAMGEAYRKIKDKVHVAGFRTGKVPMTYLEKTYGPSLFYEDAFDILASSEYSKAVESAGLDVLSGPSHLKIIQMKKGLPLIFSVDVAVPPTVVLGQYKGMEVQAMPAVVISDEEVEKELLRLQKEHPAEVPVAGRPAAEGDVADIDFTGYRDGVPFEGGSAERYCLELGSGTFIPGFEEQVAGHWAGDEFDVQVTFPENYNAEELAGQPAVFSVKLNCVKVKKQLPLDDDFARMVFGKNTLDELAAEVRRELTEKQEKKVRASWENAVLEQAAANAEMDISPLMVDEEAELWLKNLENEFQHNGLTLEQYLDWKGTTREGLLAEQRPEAEQIVRVRLLLAAVVEAEGLAATEQDVEQELAERAAEYQLEVSRVREMLGEENIDLLKKDMALKKAQKLILETVVEI